MKELDRLRNAVGQTGAAGNVDPGEARTARLYRVQEDDDLCSIAVRHYGLADFWVFIHSANAEDIARNGGIHPGQILAIPDL